MRFKDLAIGDLFISSQNNIWIYQKTEARTSKCHCRINQVKIRSDSYSSYDTDLNLVVVRIIHPVSRVTIRI